MGAFDFVLAAKPSRETDLQKPDPWAFEALGAGAKSASGIRVSPRRAFNLSIYYACIRNISEDLGKLPWDLYEKSGDERAIVQGIQLERLLHLPNPYMSGQAWREVLVTWALGWGNGYSEIERDWDDTPLNLWPIHPGLVTPFIDPESYELLYFVMGHNGMPSVVLPSRDVYHLHGIGFDGITGASTAQLHADEIGNQLAHQEFEGAIFQAGAVSRGVLEYPKKLDDPTWKRLRKSWARRYGGPRAAAHPVILENGMKFTATQINPRDAMMIESTKEGALGIARQHRMPPHKVGLLDRATFSNIEHQALEYVVDTLLTWAVRLETEYDRKLIRDDFPARRLFSRIDLRGLLRGDYTARTEGYERLIRSGILTPDEARALEDMNPYGKPAAKKLWMQSAMQPIDILETPPPAAPGLVSNPDRKTGEGGKPGNQPPPKGTDVGNRALTCVDALTPVLDDAAGRIARRHATMLARDGRRSRMDAGFVARERGVLVEILEPGARAFLGMAERLGLPAAPDAARSEAAAVVDGYLRTLTEPNSLSAAFDEAAARETLTSALSVRLARLVGGKDRT